MPSELGFKLEFCADTHGAMAMVLDSISVLANFSEWDLIEMYERLIKNFVERYQYRLAGAFGIKAIDTFLANTTFVALSRINLCQQFGGECF